MEKKLTTFRPMTAKEEREDELSEMFEIDSEAFVHPGQGPLNKRIGSDWDSDSTQFVKRTATPQRGLGNTAEILGGL